MGKNVAGVVIETIIVPGCMIWCLRQEDKSNGSEGEENSQQVIVRCLENNARKGFSLLLEMKPRKTGIYEATRRAGHDVEGFSTSRSSVKLILPPATRGTQGLQVCQTFLLPSHIRCL